jgi:glucosamine--fructose-6-phosphate aminotransferase (isomerizing)
VCGIFASIGSDSAREGNDGTSPAAAERTLGGLQRLEYRGYDSWGIAVAAAGRFERERAVGSVAAQRRSGLPPASLALGHTRWATHGAVTVENAHPHLDCAGRLALVHNGIFENAGAVRATLRAGHRIASTTDSEVLAHVIEEEMPALGLRQAARRAFQRFHGANACVVADAREGTLVALRDGSPLVIGVGEGEYWLSSDIDALRPLTRRIVALEDGQYAELTPSGYQIFSLADDTPIEPTVCVVEPPDTASAPVAEHRLLSEILEEPAVLARVAAGFPAQAAPLCEVLRRAARIHLVGCGAAYFAALAGVAFLADVAGREAAAAIGSEFQLAERFLAADSAVVYLSQSGETLDLLTSVRRVLQTPARVATLVNAEHSTLQRAVPAGLLLHAGQERAVVSTKAFAAKLACLGLLACALAGRLEEGIAELLRAREKVAAVLSPAYQRAHLDGLVSLLARQPHLFVIGRGFSHPVALNGALNIKEVSYLHAEGLAGGELKHGTLALIEAGTPCIVLAPADETHADALSAAHEVSARGGLVIGLAARHDPAFAYHLPIAEAGRFTCLPQMAVLQLLAYKLAVALHRDPDRPRNLAKAVTVR